MDFQPDLPAGALPVWRSAGFAFLLAAAFVCANTAIGRIVFRIPMLASLQTTDASRLFFQLAAGTYVTSSLLLLLAALFGLTDTVAALFGIICASALAYDAIKSRASFVAALRSVNARHRRWALAGTAVALLWFSPYGIRAVLPLTDWDALMYHIPLAKRILSEGVWSIDPYFTHHNYPAVWHLFYSIFIKLHSTTAVSVFTLLLGGLVSLAVVYEFARCFWGRVSAGLAVLLYLSSNVIWTYAATPRIDNVQGLYFLLAVYAVMLFLRHREQPGWLMLAALNMSMVLGLKYTGIVLLAVLLPVLLLAFRRSDFARLLPALAICCGIVIFPAAFWYARNWLQLGDPCYPFATKKLLHVDETGARHDFFRDIDAYIARNSPSQRDLAAAVHGLGADDLLSPASTASTPRLLNVWDVMTHPRSYAQNTFVTIPHIFILFAALPLFCRNRSALILWYIGIAGFLCIAIAGHRTRYLAPIIPVIAAGTSVVLAELYSWCCLRLRKLANLMSVAVGLYLCGYIGTNVLVEVQRLRSVKAFQYLLGRQSSLDLLSRENGGASLIAPIRYFNSRSMDPRSAGVLMVFENRCYPILNSCWGDHPTFAGHRWLAFAMDSGGDYGRLKRRLQEVGIRYILVNLSGLAGAKRQAMETINRGDPLSTETHRRRLVWGFYHLERFLSRHASLVGAGAGASIFEIRGD